MFDFIIGDIVSINEDFVVIQNNGIGYRVYTSITSMMDMEIGRKNQMLYTQLHVRDDAMLLFGFISEEEMDMFNLLLKVSSIGPKTGLNILSTITPSQIKVAIHNRDYKTLCKAPGIGKKTAERMVLELKDKVGDIDEKDIVEGKAPTEDHEEAVEALVSLGYLKFEVEKVLKNMDLENMDIEEVIREGLKKLSRN